MNFEWNYFDKPRVIGFGVEDKAFACKINGVHSILYWVKDEIEGLKLIEITGR